jgi:hypothetical protein
MYHTCVKLQISVDELMLEMHASVAPEQIVWQGFIVGISCRCGSAVVYDFGVVNR